MRKDYLLVSVTFFAAGLLWGWVLTSAHESKDKAPVVVPVVLPPVTDTPVSAASEAERIRSRQNCLINSWSRMNELSVGMRDEYARQIKKACGVE